MILTARDCGSHQALFGGPIVKRIVFAAIAIAVSSAAGLRAQGSAIDQLKGKIFDAHMAQSTFVNGLRYCKDLNGSNFYFEPRNRLLNLEEYHRSLENLAREHVFNPEKHKPWNEEDAEARWEQVKQEAIKDKANCDLVASLPDLERQLRDLEKNAAAPKNP
jgi:hypothetical protein